MRIKIKNIETHLESNLDSIIEMVIQNDGTFLFSTPDGKNIVGLNPIVKIIDNEIFYADKKVEKSPLKFIQQVIAKNKDLALNYPLFCGLIGYDFKNKIEEKNIFTGLKRNEFPDIFFAIYEYYLIFDDFKDVTLLKLDFNFNYNSLSKDKIKQALQKTDFQLNYNKKSSYTSTSLNKAEFERGVDKIKSYILNGDIYQANLTREIKGITEFSVAEIAKLLYNSNNIEFGVFAKINDDYIISTTPERLFTINKNQINTYPIKGTIRKTNNEIENKKNANELLNCPKNLPELAMIVDLLRNDLNKIAIPGSVKVEKFPILKELSNVYHLVANIKAELSTNDFEKIIYALFPGGSITGCPKIRACQIIEELEKIGRGPYTGSFGYINFNGDMDFNILIRTLFYYSNQEISFNVGGGITLLSDPEDEYKETIYKAKNIYDAINMEEIWEERYCL